MNNFQHSEFRISQMDCPSEEQLIRMKLQPFLESIQELNFDIPQRRLSIVHTLDFAMLQQALLELNLGAQHLGTNPVQDYQFDASTLHAARQKAALLKALYINAFFFVLEIIAGFIAHSMGLIADSLDMLADTLIYSLALFAVGSTFRRKKNIARLSGLLQVILAVLGFYEIIHRFIVKEHNPDFFFMIAISVLALAGNTACLYILRQSDSKEQHMQASMIFTSNDIIANAGVIVAGLLVWAIESAIPDLIIGSIVFILILRGAIAILKL
jgi:Co/Zn/Cd efflux system component